MRNSTGKIVFMPKHTHLADLRICESRDFGINNVGVYSNAMKIYDISRDDLNHLIPPERLAIDDKDYTHEILLDPDNQMPAT